MKTPNGTLASKIKAGEFVITAEYVPPAAADDLAIKTAIETMGDSLAAVSVADNNGGIGTSSLAASSVLLGLGREPIYQVVTRDRNRIAIQSDLLGASVLGIKNVVCTSGHHQTLTGCSNSANVYDLDAIQVILAIRQMRDEGTLLNGTTISGRFSMLIGTVANPYLRPLDLNMIQLSKKTRAGADFIHTQPVFDTDEYALWLDATHKEGLADRAAILVGILPLSSAEEAEKLRDAHTELRIPDSLVARLKAATNADAQETEGMKICAEIVGKVKGMKGVRGIHILSGGREKLVSKLRAAAGL